MITTATWTDAKKRAAEEVDKLQAQMEEIAHDIHEHPETGWDTPRSAARLTNYLEEHGLKVERGVAGLECSFKAYAEEREGQHPSVGLLAEYDALPGLGHGCGHNMIGTVSCTAGIALTRVLREMDIPGVAYVMGTPFEEGGGGKIVMIEKGCFQGIDAASMFHPGNEYVVCSPHIACRGLNLKFHGRTAHAGAAPHEGINAADGAMIMFAAVNALRQHVTPDVRIHGVILSGGDAANVVPDYAEVSMLVRAQTRRALEDVYEKVKNCAKAGALASGARLEMDEGLMFLNNVPVDSYRQVGLENLELLGLPVPQSNPQKFHSADGGNVSWEMPHLGFGMPIDPEFKCVPHTPEFTVATDSDMARDTMNKAAKMMALSMLDLLQNPDLLATVRRDHAALVAAG